MFMVPPEAKEIGIVGRVAPVASAHRARRRDLVVFPGSVRSSLDVAARGHLVIVTAVTMKSFCSLDNA
jgi:hypothetical protein